MIMRLAGFLALLLICALNVQAAPEADVPIAPIATKPAMGWPEAIALDTASSRAVLVPATGRLASWAIAGETNVFYHAEQWAGKQPGDPAAGAVWINFGGWSLWPAPTSAWELLQSAGWRPSRVVDGGPWSGRGWVAADRALTALLEREFPAPLHLAVRRTFRLDPDRAVLQVRESITRVRDSDVPVAPWSVLQIVRPSRIILPRESDMPIDQALRVRDPRLSYDVLHETDHAWVFTCSGQSRMDLQPVSGRAWMAFEIGRQLLVVRGVDGTARLRFYLDQGQPRAEIEYCPAAEPLKAGESMSHTLELRLAVTRSGASAAYLARQARRLAGDETAPDEGGPASSELLE